MTPAKMSKLDQLSFVKQVLKQLPEHWEVMTPEPDDFTIKVMYARSEEVYLYFSFDRAEKGKVVVSGNLHIREAVGQGWHYVDPRSFKAESPSITVSYSRGADTVGKEVMRRLMKPYLSLIAEGINRRNESRKYHQEVHAKLLSLAQLAGYSRISTIQAGANKFETLSSDPVRCEVYVGSYGVDLKLENLPYDIACAVLTWAKLGYPAPEPKAPGTSPQPQPKPISQPATVPTASLPVSDEEIP